MISIKSNIKIKSNVYLLSDSDHPEKDAAFVSQIFSAASLESLKKRADENGVEIVLSDVQKRILNGETNIKLSEIRSADNSPQAEEVTGQAPEDPEYTEVTVQEEAAQMPSIEAAEHIEQADQSGQTSEDDVMADMPSVEAVEHIETAGQTAENADAADMPSIEAVGRIGAVEQTAQADAVLEEMPSVQAEAQTDLDKLLKRGFGGVRTLIVCADRGYAKYVSFMLHKNNCPNMLMNEAAAPVRHFADVLWDCNDKIIGRENFVKRFTARCSDEAARADECFDALCGFAGSDPSAGLDPGALAEKIMRGDVPDSLFGGNNNITVAAADDADHKSFDKIYVLENGYDDPSLIAVNMGAACAAIADCPEVICGEGGSAVIVDGSESPAVSASRDDVDALSFIGGTVGDAVRKQAYISQNVKRGDEIKLELKDGVYDIVHNKMVIARMSEGFSERVTGEFGGKSYFDRLPQSLGGLIVTDIITVVSCRGAEEFGEAVPPQFRDRNFWLGVELGGFAFQLV